MQSPPKSRNFALNGLTFVLRRMIIVWHVFYILHFHESLLKTFKLFLKSQIFFSFCVCRNSKDYAMRKAAFNEKNRPLTDKLNPKLKKRIVKNLIWSIVLYGTETWVLKVKDNKLLGGFGMWTCRRRIKIRWVTHQSNEEVLCRVKEERSSLKVKARG